jgi:LAGLIDADG DNA endonuclease family
MDEVSDPAMSVLAEGLYFVFILEKCGGLKSYILNKMKDTYKSDLSLFKREKNNTLVSRSVQIKNTFLYKPLTSKNFLYSTKDNNLNVNISYTLKTKFHTKVRAGNRIGPHNVDVISVLVGSLLGDGYANSRIIEGTRFCFKQSIVHKDYLF